MKQKNQLKQKTPLQSLLIFVSVGMISLMTTGCLNLGLGGGRVVFVDTESEMVRLGPDVEGHVYYFDEGEWVKSKKKVKLPEGWYAGGMSSKKED
jgi:hypothetical protein